MSNFINKVTIQGNLGSDPITRATKKGGNFATFSVATQTEYVKEDGKQQKFVEWHNVVVFDEFLTFLVRGNFKKGDLIKVEGALSNSNWEDKEGRTNHKTQIVVRNSKVHKLEKIFLKEGI